MYPVHDEVAQMVADAEALQAADPAAAARMFRVAADRAGDAADASLVVGAYTREAQAWADAGQPSLARSAAGLGVALIDDLVAPDMRIAHQTNLGISLQAAGFDSEGEDLLEAALAEARESAAPDARTEGVILLNLAVGRTKTGRAADAVDLLAEASALLGGTEPLLAATVSLNEAVALSALEQPRAARAAYVSALELYLAAGATDADVGTALRGQAVNLAKLGRFPEALDLYREATGLFERGGRPDEVLRTKIGELAALFMLGVPIPQSDLDGLEASLQGRSADLVGQMSRNIGNVRMRDGDFDAAERAYGAARRAFAQLGARGEVASVDSNRAIMFAKRGELDRARRLMAKVRATQESLGNWLAVANADVNLASFLEEVADQEQPARPSLLTAARKRVVAAIEAVDRHRHGLGTAADRAALMANVYGGLFPLGIQLALRSGDLECAAALIERSRVQPVLSEPGADDQPYEAPLTVSARRQPDGGGAAVLVDEAERIAGSGARWLGWWTNSDIIVGTIASRSVVKAYFTTVDGQLDALARAVPVPLDQDRQLARSDSEAHLRCLERTLRGPLVGDDAAADVVARLLPGRLDPTLGDETVGSSDVDQDLLWALTVLLFPPVLRRELADAAAAGSPVPLVLAVPPQLGRVPWAALPLTDPRLDPGANRLVEGADLTIGLPVSLSVAHGRRVRPEASGPPVLVADPLGDLRWLRQLDLPGAVRLGAGGETATRTAVLGAASGTSLLVLGSHVLPGSAVDPATSAVVLAGTDGHLDALSVAELAATNVPSTCVLFTCDGAGAATGSEWTGIATGLVWGGADWVVTTVCPIVEDRAAAEVDQELLDSVVRLGPREGLWDWQRSKARQLRDDPGDLLAAPLRWAATVVIGAPGASG